MLTRPRLQEFLCALEGRLERPARQGPAEFRRKWKGLRQRWRALLDGSPVRVP